MQKEIKTCNSKMVSKILKLRMWKEKLHARTKTKSLQYFKIVLHFFYIFRFHCKTKNT